MPNLKLKIKKIDINDSKLTERPKNLSMQSKKQKRNTFKISNIEDIIQKLIKILNMIKT